MEYSDVQKWIDIEEGWDFWHTNRERVILLWKEGDQARVGMGNFHGGSWLIEGKAHRYSEGEIQPTHFIPLPDKPDEYDDWEY